MAMPGIFKVSYNKIDSEQPVTKEGGKPRGTKTFHQWTKGPEALDEPARFDPITRGDADDSATLLADDAEHAIALLRKATIGESYDFEDDDNPGEWKRSATEFIQIVRVEPVAFTTL